MASRRRPITFQWWWLRMLRELATIPDMMAATNRYPHTGLIPQPTHNKNLRAAGFGEQAKRDMGLTKARPRKVTLPVPPREITEGDDGK